MTPDLTVGSQMTVNAEFWGDMEELREGLYESLLTIGLGNQIAATVELEPEIRPVDTAEQPDVLARHVRDAAFRALSSQREPAKRVAIVNALLGLLEQVGDEATGDPRQLRSLSRSAAPGITVLSTVRPAIPLNPPGFAGDSVSWEGWGHVEKIWELPEGAAGPCCSD